MTGLERTLQQRDPFAAIVGRPTTYVVAAGLPVYAGLVVWFNRFDTGSLSLAIASLFTLSLTVIFFVYTSSPLRAPFSRRAFATVVAGAVTAHVLSAASMLASNQFIRDDWGPTAIAVVIFAASPYRPAKDIAAAGAIAGLTVVAVLFAQVPSLATDVPFHLVALVAITPILVLTLGASVLSRELDAGLERWSQMQTMSATALGDGGNEWIARSVQQDRVTLLNQEIVPFFETVLSAKSLSQTERSRASELSSAIRAIMVAEIDRSWLDGLLESEARTHGDPRIMRRVIDKQGLADDMTPEQRTAIRAFIVALFSLQTCRPESVEMVIEKRFDLSESRLSATVNSSEISLRGTLDPYLALLRIVFTDLQVDFSQPELTLRFSYGERRDRS